eukprot:2483727-Amphidinium_carterae.1
MVVPEVAKSPRIVGSSLKASLLQAALGSGQEQLQLDAQQLQVSRVCPVSRIAGPRCCATRVACCGKAMAGYMDPAAYGQAKQIRKSTAGVHPIALPL